MSSATTQMMPSDAAACFLSWLESRGALVTLNADQTFRVDLDGVSDFGNLSPDVCANVVLSLRDEIRQILLARRVMH